jgi:DNA (cytosine-5)-methyltransferase 1
LTAIDLFAGAGGLSLGFKWAGVSILGAIESDSWAAETYQHNFPNTKVFVRDIRCISDEEVLTMFSSNPAIIIGGPPCQGFSISNTKNKDPKDPRNSLFREFIRFVKILKPRACLIENVKGLAVARTEDGKKVIEIIRDEFKEIGYNSISKMLNAADYGVPQYRERLFMVALDGDSEKSFIWPEKTCGNSVDSNQLTLVPKISKPYVTLWEAISDLPQITCRDHEPELPYRKSPENDYQELMRSGAGDFVFNHEPMKHTSRIVERYSHIGFGQSESDSPIYLRPRLRGSPSTNSTVTYDQNSRRQRPNKVSYTIVASSHTNYIHPFLNRNFTVRELARIQSFPDCFEFRGKRAVLSHKLSLRKGLVEDAHLDQRMQIGNAVPPLLARAIALSIIKHLKSQ